MRVPRDKQSPSSRLAVLATSSPSGVSTAPTFSVSSVIGDGTTGIYNITWNTPPQVIGNYSLQLRCARWDATVPEAGFQMTRQTVGSRRLDNGFGTITSLDTLGGAAFRATVGSGKISPPNTVVPPISPSTFQAGTAATLRITLYDGASPGACGVLVHAAVMTDPLFAANRITSVGSTLLQVVLVNDGGVSSCPSGSYDPAQDASSNFVV
jgi:hypothetical protein